jgi:hypothetical protein
MIAPGFSMGKQGDPPTYNKTFIHGHGNLS